MDGSCNVAGIKLLVRGITRVLPCHRLCSRPVHCLLFSAVSSPCLKEEHALNLSCCLVVLLPAFLPAAFSSRSMPSSRSGRR
eukprot:SAG22_NODE_33_length_27588_cov_104.174652_21_plen_82_part_00